jgi:hypothetical protein
MAGPGVTNAGPFISGTIWNPGDARGPVNTGLSVIAQKVTLTQNGTATVTGQINVPDGSQLLAFYIDNTVAWNSGTTAPLTIGLTAGGADFLSGTSLATAGRLAGTAFTAAQLVAMQQVGAGTTNGIPIFFTVTPTGTAATAGTTIITLIYIQTVQLNAGTA